MMIFCIFALIAAIIIFVLVKLYNIRWFLALIFMFGVLCWLLVYGASRFDRKNKDDQESSPEEIEE